MTSATTFMSILLVCIILQCSGAAPAGSKIRDAEKKFTGHISSRTESNIQLADRNMSRQGFGDPCSCSAVCLQGSCMTAVAGGVNVGPLCLPNDDFLYLNGVPLLDINPVSCSVPSTGGSAGENTGGVCIAADMLSGLGSHQLIFEKHVLAPVLCDASGSCATKGHIVSYKGTGMMMGSYCGIVGCVKKIMAVNSPKYNRALKVQSKSPDMHFTAFAARFETRGEEAVLAAAIRVGL